jgi:hypothetical protein
VALGPGDRDEVIMVTLNISCTSEEMVARVSEQLGRMAAGLVLDGCDRTTVSFTKLDPPEEGWNSG